MGIYIKGVEMPKDCNSCPMRVNEVLDFCSVVAFSVEDYLDRPPFCPLTEVAEPHGRLIDADKLLGECRPRGIADDVWKASNEYKQIINAPTVIESEVEK